SASRVGQAALARTAIHASFGRSCRGSREAADGVRSLALGRTPFHFDRHNGLIVEGVDALGVLGRSLENRFHNRLGRIAVALVYDLLESRASEQITSFVGGVEDAVAEENEHVFGFSLESEFVVLGVIE